MNERQFDSLLLKFISNTINKEELKVFMEYVKEYDPEVLSQKLDNELANIHVSNANSDYKENIFSQIEKIIDEEKTTKTKSKIITFRNNVATLVAIFLAVFFLTLYFNNSHPDDKHSVLDSDILYKNELITISVDGQNKIELSDLSKGAYDLGNLTIQVNKDGNISYKIKQNSSNFDEDITIETPRGKQSYLKLSDGSEIWLNAMSKVVFRPNLTSNQRSLTLSGEAYFEVAHDAKRPFKVKTNSSVIEVLGTGFNISSYKGETEHTTLVHGKVKVQHGDLNKVIKPNQQFKVLENNSYSINNVDVQEFTAWKSGELEFYKKNIKEVLYQLQKWYPIENIQIDKLSDDTFSGTFKKDRSLRNVLDQLELISSYKFIIEKGVVKVQ